MAVQKDLRSEVTMETCCAVLMLFVAIPLPAALAADRNDSLQFLSYI